MSLAPPPGLRLNKPAAANTVVELIKSSALAARGLVGVLDGGSGSHQWQPPRSAHLPVLGPPHFEATEDAVSRQLAFLGRQRADIPAGSFVFVVSDFLQAPSSQEWSRALAHGWDVVPVVVQDPHWESDFPDLAGVTIRLADVRTGRLTPARFTSREVAMRQMANRERLAALMSMFRRLGIDPVLISSAEPVAAAAAFFSWADERVYARGYR
jgi:hypothetical protein